MECNVKCNYSVSMIGSDGSHYASIRRLSEHLGVDNCNISKWLKRTGVYTKNGVEYRIETDLSKNSNEESHVMSCEEDKEYKEFLESKKVESLPFTKYSFKKKHMREGTRYAIALFSDAHIEETVDPDSVLGLNKYNIEIAKERIGNYFVNLVNCLNEDGVEHLVFASLGDTISGYIHEELSQMNGLSPLEATLEAQNLIYSGIEYICSNAHLSSFKFIGIVGNHSRITKKIQHANGFKMSYEWLMYKNIEKECKIKNLPIEFYLPESEMAIVETMDDKTFIFCHGFQIKGSGTGTVCGIYPALQRLALKWGKTFHQDRIFLGHFHSCVSIPSAVVNGSVIGYNSYSLSNGFEYEVPAQQYIVYDTSMGELLNRKIYCL